MKKIQEKVKDIVEVRKFSSLQDFTSDPSVTLANYHFTDATAELMAKWLDRLSELQDGRGNASALAGYRGVGKSHFMATFGAVASLPELRTKVSDAHVAAGAQRLMRRRYPIAYVRRGTRDTLLEELRDAVAKSFDLELDAIPEAADQVVRFARERAGDVPLIMLIDTAFERGSRVTRDDGPILAEIADVAKEVNSFVGVALDDDIAGADGSNAAIIRSYTIDYLDQEHLYKVVDAHVFPKNPQLRPVLHDIYEYFREVLPTFRWSEQRFSSLYPLHPAILEVAPFVRLYVHDFALLGFASEAGERILGRPANSLIALDEVFDNAETGLRKIEDLEEAFVAYDRLNADVVAKIPVMQRLQAKLILKALLLLSLDGQGTTPGEIAAGMMIFDESDPNKAAKTVEELIRMFASALPEDVQAYSEDGRGIRYGFKVSSKENLNKELAAITETMQPDIVQDVLHRLIHERFGDSTFFSLDGSRKDVMESQLVWRGGLRRGRVVWSDERSAGQNAPVAEDIHDWEVIIEFTNKERSAPGSIDEISTVVWKPAELRKDEVDAILRYYALSTNQKLREDFGDQIRASLHSHTVLAERIVNRVFLEDGLLTIDNFDYNFTEDARVAPTLGDLFTTMLEPLFELRFPQHPYFLRRLGMAEVATIVSDLYSSSRQKLSEVQQLAQIYALPLGLARLRDGVYLPETEESLAALPAVDSILKLVENGKDGASLKSIYAELKKAPNGLVREAQQLIMAGMVAQRMIEFVTSKGDRINQRSLDLKIIWDDIIGVAKPQESVYSTKNLLKWAAVFTGDQSFKSFDDEADRRRLADAFKAWFDEWHNEGVLTKFNALPPEAMNTKIWRTVTRTNKSLGSVGANIKLCLEKSIQQDECLGRIADAFMDDPSQMDKSMDDLAVVDSFVKSFAAREEIRAYLALSEPTVDEEIEKVRDELTAALNKCDADASETNAREMGYLWTKFHREYSEHFIALHDTVMKSHALQAKFEECLRSDDWWEFENLTAAGALPETELARIQRTKRKLENLNCQADTTENLKTRPFCSCAFSLSRVSQWESLPDSFAISLDAANRSAKRTLIDRKAELIPVIEKIGKESGSADVSAAASELVKGLNSNTVAPNLPVTHLQIIRRALAKPASQSAAEKNKSTPAEKPKTKPAAAPADDLVLMNI